MYSQQDFNKDVFSAIARKTGYIPSDEECRAVAHHMEYNVRADRHMANNGHLIISTSELRKNIILQIKNNLHQNDIPRYTEQYKRYKKIQKYSLLTQNERNDIIDIASGKKKIADYSDKDYLKNIYIKYFNQILMPKIEQISLQKKFNLKYHGLWHTEQVAMIAVDIAISEKHNPLPILVAAGLHDCARSTDGHDPDHGINCKPIAEDFLKNYSDRNLLTQEQKGQIVEAVVFHNSPSRPKGNHILDCLQDADSMRLLWVNYQRFVPNTLSGQTLAKYSPQQQIRYLVPLIEKMRATRPFSGRSFVNSLTL